MNAVFTSALRAGGPDSPIFNHYVEVLANPAAGRFAGRDDNPGGAAKLATWKDYARVVAHVIVADEAGADLQAVVAEHGLTLYEFSQESRKWTREMEIIPSDRLDEWNAIRDAFEAEYRVHYRLN